MKDLSDLIVVDRTHYIVMLELALMTVEMLNKEGDFEDAYQKLRTELDSLRKIETLNLANISNLTSFRGSYN